MDSKIITYVIGFLMLGGVFAVGGSAVYHYLFDLEFTNIESASVEVGSLKQSLNSENYLSNTLPLTSLFSEVNKSGSIIYEIEDVGDYYSLQYVVDGVIKVWGRDNPVGYVTAQEVIDEHPIVANCDWCERMGNPSIIPFRTNALVPICALDGLEYISYVPSTDKKSPFMQYLGRWYYYSSTANPMTYPLEITCGSLEYDIINISKTDYDNYFLDSETKETILLFTNDEYNNMSDSMSLVVNHDTAWNTYEYYLGINDDVLYMDDLVKSDRSYIGGDLRNFLDIELSSTSYGLFVRGSIEEPQVVLAISEEDFILVKSYSVDAENFKFEYISNHYLDNVYSVGTNVTEITKLFPVDKVVEFGTDESINLKADNIAKSTLVRPEMIIDINEEFSFKFSSKDVLEEVIAFNTDLFNDYTKSRFTDLITLEDNSDFTYNNQSYKFGNNSATILTSNILIHDGDIVSIEDLSTASEDIELEIEGSSVVFSSNELIKYSNIGTIYENSNITIQDSKLISNDNWAIYKSIILPNSITDYSSVLVDETLYADVNVPEGILMFSINSVNGLEQISYDLSINDSLEFNTKLYDNFIYLESRGNEKVQIIENYDNTNLGMIPILIEGTKIDMSNNFEGLRIKIIE